MSANLEPSPSTILEKSEKSGEELTLELLVIREDLKQAIKTLFPENNEDSQPYWVQLQKIKVLPESQRNIIADSEELKSLSKQLLFAHLRNAVEKKEYSKLNDKLKIIFDLFQVLGISKVSECDNEGIGIIKDVITNLQPAYDVSRFIPLVRVMHIPTEVLDDLEVRRALPVDSGISGYLTSPAEVYVEYLNGYFSDERRTEILAGGIENFCCSLNNGKNPIELLRVVELVNSTNGFNKNMLLQATKKGMIKGLEENKNFSLVGICKVLKVLDLEQDLRDDPEMQTAVKERIVRPLAGDIFQDQMLESMLELDDFFQLSKNSSTIFELQGAILKNFSNYLLGRYWGDSERNLFWQVIFQRFSLPLEQVQKTTLSLIIKLLQRVTEHEDDIEYHELRKISELIPNLVQSGFIQDKDLLLNDSVQAAFFALVESAVTANDYVIWELASSLLVDFPVKRETVKRFNSAQLIEPHFLDLVSRAENDELRKAKLLAEKFTLATEFIQLAAMEGITKNFQFYPERMLERKNLFDLSETQFVDALTEGMRVSATQDIKDNKRHFHVSRMSAKKIKKIKDGIPLELLQKTISASIIHALESADSVDVILVLKSYAEQLGLEIAPDPLKIERANKMALIGYLSGAKLDDAYALLDYKTGYSVSLKVLQDNEVLDAAHQALIALIKKNAFSDIDALVQKFSLKPRVIEDPQAQEVVKSKMRNALKSLPQSLEIGEMASLLKKYPLPLEVVVDQDIVRLGKHALVAFFVSAELDMTHATFLAQKLNIPQSEIEDCANDAFKKVVKKYWSNQSTSFFTRMEELAVISQELNSRFDLLAISMATFGRVKLDWASDIDFKNLTEKDYIDAFNFAKEHSLEWSDEQTVVNSFQKGVETFGFKRMLEYITKDHLSIHDALHAFPDILELFQVSGLSATQFYGQILQQVQAEDGEYFEGSAHHHLNAIAQSVDKDVSAVVAKAQRYQQIKKLQELIEAFSSPREVFASWENLKRYSRLERYLKKKKIFDELVVLAEQGKDKLYSFIETLAFHQSKVDMEKVILFWRDPRAFFEAIASHTPKQIHDNKKPSNYIDMPNLDLTAEELRDALVEGKMDSLQAFSALEITYEVPTNGEVSNISLRDAMRTALGSRRQGIEGTARSVQRLFAQLSAALKPHGLTIQAYLEGAELPENIDQCLIENLIYHPEFGISRQLASQKFIAKINLKSDPQGVLAGNDTANCMPFGDGKSTVYTFNPNTAQFLLQIVREDGSARTIAQSVLTKDMDVELAVPKILEALTNNKFITSILPENLLRNSPAYIACDNVEVAPNYASKYELIIEQIYRDFFREYVKMFGATQQLVTDKVVIGQGYADALKRLPTAPNTYIPQAPVSYSDKTGEKVFVLDLPEETGDSPFIHRSVKVAEPELSRTELPLISFGLEYLTFEDSLRVGYLEGKAYSDNKSMMVHLHNMENCLIAKDINNIAKNRPNLSLKYSDRNGKMTGYLLAYEGIIDDRDLLSVSTSKKYYDTRAIYIADLASDKENPMTGGRLINGFIDLYKRNYLEVGDMIPLFMEAREQTSFRIIKRQLDKIGQSLEVEFDLIELPTSYRGADIMHPVVLVPRKRE